MNSSVTLNFKKSYFKDIKEVCNENLDEFRCKVFFIKKLFVLFGSLIRALFGTTIKKFFRSIIKALFKTTMEELFGTMMK